MPDFHSYPELDLYVGEHMVSPEEIVQFPCIRIMVSSAPHMAAVSAIATTPIKDGGLGWRILGWAETWGDWMGFVSQASKDAEALGIPLYIDKAIDTHGGTLIAVYRQRLAQQI